MPPKTPVLRSPTPEELSAFQAVAQATNLVLAPIEFNGEFRFALGILHQRPDGKALLQIVAVLPSGDDSIQGMTGNSATTGSLISHDKKNMN